MKIENSIYSLGQLNKQLADNKSKASSAANELTGSFANMLQEVNQNITQADQKIAALASGKGEQDISGAMIALEKSDISVKLLLAVRNKLLSAYQEVSRMPV